MSPAEPPERDPDATRNGQGVLSNLPRTRPQRATAGRAAARKANARAEGASTKTAPRKAPAARTSAGTKASRPRRRTGTAKGARPTAAAAAASGRRGGRRDATRRLSVAAEPVPRQGYECEFERLEGSVSPPGSGELLAAATEAVGELAKAGLSRGERILRDLTSRLPLP